jgi:hypothetical protein
MFDIEHHMREHFGVLVADANGKRLGDDRHVCYTMEKGKKSKHALYERNPS